MSNAGKNRQESQPAFVLHAYPFRETSLVVEAFTRNFGRVGLVARGARRPRSAMRGMLLAFQPLLMAWSGKSELRTLHRVEWQGGLMRLQGMALLCGFYLNELLVRLLPRDDPHERLFMYYQVTLQALGRQQDFAAILRRFEKQLLKELGYALTLDREVESGRTIEPDRRYAYVIERGPLPAVNGEVREHSVQLSGKTLLDMDRDDYTDPITQQQSKALMRVLINHYLGDKPLYTRQLLKDLHQP